MMERYKIVKNVIILCNGSVIVDILCTINAQK